MKGIQIKKIKDCFISPTPLQHSQEKQTDTIYSRTSSSFPVTGTRHFLHFLLLHLFNLPYYFLSVFFFLTYPCCIPNFRFFLAFIFFLLKRQGFFSLFQSKSPNSKLLLFSVQVVGLVSVVIGDFFLDTGNLSVFGIVVLVHNAFCFENIIFQNFF